VFRTSSKTPQSILFDVTVIWLTVSLLHAEAGKAPQHVGLPDPSRSLWRVSIEGQGTRSDLIQDEPD